MFKLGVLISPQFCEISNFPCNFVILPNISCSYNYSLFAVDANFSKIASFREFLCSWSTEFRITLLTSTSGTVFTGYWQCRTFAGMLFLSLLLEIGLFWPTTWHLFYFKKPAFEKHKAQKAKKLRNVRNIARLKFRNLQKFFLINQTIFETQLMKQMLTCLCIKYI